MTMMIMLMYDEIIIRTTLYLGRACSLQARENHRTTVMTDQQLANESSADCGAV